MKMIIAIVNNEDSEKVTHSLTDAGFRVTTIASTGGFLRKGLSTLLCALEEEKLQVAIDLIRNCFTPVSDPSLKRCKLFVLNVADYHHF